MPHPDEGLIHAWLDGELGGADAARVEALVASDRKWAAAAAEARGLIAASARIAAALDRAPAVPRSATAPRRATVAWGRRWGWRAAAAIVLMGGSAVVLERRPPSLPGRVVRDQPAANGAPVRANPHVPVAGGAPARANPHVPVAGALRAAAPGAGEPMPPAPPVVRNAPAARSAEAKSNLQSEDLDASKRNAPARVGGGAAAAVMAQRAFAPEAAPQRECFEQRQPRDSANRILTFDARALADSVRLETLAIHGDTISAVNGRLTAVRVRCPER